MNKILVILIVICTIVISALMQQITDIKNEIIEYETCNIETEECYIVQQRIEDYLNEEN